MRLPEEVEDKFIRAFVRTSKPATTEGREIETWHRCGRDSDLQTFGPERRRTGQNSCSLGKQFVHELYSRLVPILALAYEHDLDPEIVLCSKVVPGNPPD